MSNPGFIKRGASSSPPGRHAINIKEEDKESLLQEGRQSSKQKLWKSVLGENFSPWSNRLKIDIADCLLSSPHLRPSCWKGSCCSLEGKFFNSRHQFVLTIGLFHQSISDQKHKKSKRVLKSTFHLPLSLSLTYFYPYML